MDGLKPINLSPRGSDAAHSLAWGLIAAAVLVAGIVVGSRGFKDFDPALVSYAGATVFSAFGLGYRYAMWLRRPPTRLYWYRGWQIFLNPKRLPANLVRLAGIVWNNVVLQRFIERRGREMRGKRIREPELRSKPRTERAGPKDPQRYVGAGSRNSDHALLGLRLGEQGLQFQNVLGEAFGGGWIAA